MQRPVRLIACFAIVALAAASGARYLPGAWYAALAKPWFTPPSAVFPVVWSVLYLLMALALWRITGLENAAGRRAAVLWFVLQLLFNAAWSWVFFGHHWMRVGLLDAVLLFLAVAMTLRTFMQLDRPAGWMMAPYLAWVGLAVALNVALLQLNHG